MEIGAVNTELNIAAYAETSTKYAGNREAALQENAVAKDLIPLAEAENILLSLANGETAKIITQPAQNHNTVFAEALKLAGLKVTTENLEMIRALMTNGIPANNENIIKMNQAVRLMSGDIQKALFLLQNKIELTRNNADLLNQFANHGIKLTNQISSLAEAVTQIQDPEVKQTVINQLLFGGTSLDADSFQALDMDQVAGDLNNPTFAKTAVEGFTQKVVAEFIRQSPNNIITAAQSIPNSETKAVFEAIAQKLIPIKDMPEAVKSELFIKLNQALSEAIPDGADNPIKLDLPIDKMNQALNEALDLDAPTPLPADNTELAATLDNAVPTKFNPVEITAKDINFSNKELLDIFKQIFEENSEEYKELSKAFSTAKTDADNGFKQKLLNRFRMAPETADPKEIDRILNSLRENIEATKTQLPKSVTSANEFAASSKLLAATDDISKNLDFLNQIKNSVYVQIPVHMNGKDTNADLYVFKKDPGKSTNKNGMKSALLALDLVTMGHLETYIQKIGDAVTCQFRVENKEVESLIKTHIHKLNNQLSNLNLSLTACSYKQVEEAFTLTGSEPIIEDGPQVQNRTIQITGYDLKI